ncbi:MAG: Rv1355c family protein, partial [Cytophagales bacterium]|nr:Rv1355c family protein [Cytophagales bacterium]
MTNQISIKNYSTVSHSVEYLPRILDLSIKKDEIDFYELLYSNSDKIVLLNEVKSQLRELFKIRNPLKKSISEAEYDEGIASILNGADIDTYGLWVYYPWSYKMVHILNKDEFIELRTSRNKYKITQEEQNLLSEQKIGVIGLSVGQSIALTMAMERTFGEIRLADFDSIELTNLNRIRTGIQSLGVPKVIVAAREIAEIDPFLKVICYQEGITEENIDDFFLSGGKLNIVIEECDGLDVKILTRIKARQLGVPVVMDTSDRGMIDVERFDLEPNRALLHGFIKDIDLKELKGLTNEEKIPYLLPMVGVDTMSSRLRASAIEVGQSLTTWPQLATSVILGGALAGDVCRRIALGQSQESGRYFIDLEDLIPNVPSKAQPGTVSTPSIHTLTKEDISQHVKSLGLIPEEGQMDLSLHDLEKILQLATLAPSGGNSQPWRWHYSDKFLYLFFDKASSTSFLDFDDTASLISLGTCIENLVLAAHHLGFEVVQRPASLKESHKLISIFSFFSTGKKHLENSETHQEDSLVHQINKRFTNRKNPKFEPAEPSILGKLSELASKVPGARMQWVTDPNQMLEVGEIISACDRIRLLHTQSHFDFISKEMRWDEQELLQKMDGIAV